MSWHEVFDGTERQFEDYVLIWHEDNCPAQGFYRWKSTQWFVCHEGRHTYWTDGERYWCRPFMERFVGV